MLVRLLGLRIRLTGLLVGLLGLRIGRRSICARIVGALAQELDGVGYDLRGEPLVAGLVGPGAGAEPAFHIELGAFLDEALHRIGQSAPGHDVVPFGVFVLLAVAVAVALGSCQGKSGDLGIGAIGGISFKVTDLGVFANVTDQHDFVQ